MMLLVLAFAAYAPGLDGNKPLESAEQEARAISIGHTIRCAVCQGLSVADSPSPMAQAMLDRVRDLVREGKSGDEVRAYFVERYGEWILLEPTGNGFNLVVWLLPFVFVGVGLVIIARKSRVVDTTEKSHPVPTSGAATEDPYLKALRDETEN